MYPFQRTIAGTLSSKCKDKREDCHRNRKKYNDMKNEGMIWEAKQKKINKHLSNI